MDQAIYNVTPELSVYRAVWWCIKYMIIMITLAFVITGACGIASKVFDINFGVNLKTVVPLAILLATVVAASETKGVRD
jgi:hypothetical protein